MTYPGGVRLTLESHKDIRAGVMFIGDKGHILVNRGDIHGKPFEQLKDDPLPENRWKAAPVRDHMADFFECVKTRRMPVAPVDIAHRTTTVCHLANIAMRLKRKLAWDAKAEQIIGDDEANSWQKRQQRAPYLITM